MVLILVALSDKSTINIITNALFILLKKLQAIVSACKITKKIPHMQAYAGNFAFFLVFGAIF